LKKNNAVNGVATFTNLSINLSGSGYVLVARSPLLDTVDSFPFTVDNGTPASINPYAGFGQSTVISNAFAVQLQAIVKTASGTPVNGTTVTFNLPTSGAGGTFAGGTTTITATTNTSGIATASVITANGTVGSFAATASLNGIASPANFTLINLPKPTENFNLVLAPLVGGPNITNTAQTVTATLTDKHGRAINGVQINFTVAGTHSVNTNATTNISGTAVISYGSNLRTCLRNRVPKVKLNVQLTNGT
jgi:hypothetical protein